MGKVPTVGQASTYVMFINLAEEKDELMKNSDQNVAVV